MNTLKRTLALAATIAMAATAFASCGDSGNSGTSDSGNSSSNSDSGNSDNGDSGSASTGDGSTFTVAAWNADDVPYLIAQWKGVSADDAANNKIDGIDFINFGVGGGDAAEKYDQLFTAGSDLDVYFCEADWALKYINDEKKTMPLEELGITDADLPNIYSYTDEIGKATDGANAGKRVGVSWQAAAGGFGYRSDLAEEYLGVTSPAEMQEKIGDWSKFVAAAEEVAEKSGGKTALADTLGGMWQAYACGRTTPWVVDNTLQIDDFCKEFADTAKALWDCGGVTKNSQWSDAWTAAGTNDTCMGYFVSTWGFGGFFLNAAGGEGGDTYGKWAVCEGPQPFYWGGTWIVVNPNSDNKDDAKDFILSAVSNEESMSAYATSKPEYVNNQKVMDDLISSNTVFNQVITDNLGGQNFYAELANNAKQINFNGLITPYDATIKTDFIDAVKTEYLEGSGDWDATVEAFRNKIAEDVSAIDAG